jgi:hypothetical protein
VGFVVDKVTLGQVFYEYFRLPCQFSFHRLFHIHHNLSSQAGAISQLVADIPSGLSLIPPQEKKKKKTLDVVQPIAGPYADLPIFVNKQLKHSQHL